MIQIRRVVPNGTRLGPQLDGRLQYRFIQPTVDASGALCPGFWSAWYDVELVVSDEEYDAEDLIRSIDAARQQGEVK